MSEVNKPLLNAQKWAKEALRCLIGENLLDKESLLWTKVPIGSSSMFSGMGYSERALHYIEAARFVQEPNLPEYFHESWQRYIIKDSMT